MDFDQVTVNGVNSNLFIMGAEDLSDFVLHPLSINYIILIYRRNTNEWKGLRDG